MQPKLNIYIVVLLSVSNIMICFAQGDSWEKIGEIPEYRAFHAASVVDDIIYLIGGLTLDSYPNGSSLVQAYDPLLGTWKIKKPMPTPRTGLTTCVLNGKIYAISGQKILDTPAAASKVIEVYDPATDEWASCADLFEPRCFFGAGAVNGKLYVIGGMYQIRACNDNWEYTPETDSWIKKMKMPTLRNYHCACCGQNDKIYVFGGASGYTVETSVIVEEYDPAIDFWLKKRNMPQGIQHPRACRIGNKIYVMGGRREYPLTPTDLNLEFDPVSNTWNDSLKKMPIPRVYHTISGVNGKIYVIGGTTDGDIPGLTKDIHVYTPFTTKVSPSNPGNVPDNLSLVQNYPNPFNSTTVIEYSLPCQTYTKLTVYDILGQEIITLVNEQQKPGTYKCEWNTRDYPSGVYVYKLETEDFMQVRKMLLLR